MADMPFTLALDLYCPGPNRSPVLILVDAEGSNYRLYELGLGWEEEPVGLVLVALDEVIADWGAMPGKIVTDHALTFCHPDFRYWLKTKGIEHAFRGHNFLVEAIVREHIVLGD